MVAGHLTLKNGKYYAVLNYKNAGGQRKTKWISLGLSEKGNKRKAESELARLRAEFEPPKEVGDLSSDMLFADYLLELLEIAKGKSSVASTSATISESNADTIFSSISLSPGSEVPKRSLTSAKEK